MPAREITRLEQLAEASYAAMYDAGRYGVRDCYDDAIGYLAEAIKIAERAKMAETVARLKQRQDHFYSVYDRQFR